MRISTFASPQAIVRPDETIRGRFVVVIDALRATSVIAAAIASGAKAVIPVAETDEALAVFKQLPEGTALLCGERGGNKIPGFHLGNSPLEFTQEAVSGKTLVMSTTNGTRAILAAAGAAKLLLGALVNATAVGQAAAASGLDVTILCAGTEGLFTLEDVLAAGAIADAMNTPDAEMDDLTRTAVTLYRQHAGSLAGALADCRHAKVLRELGYGRDIEYCMGKDRLDVAPVYRNGKITKAT